MKVIAVANEKNQVGKSVISMGLLGCYARRRCRTVLIDACEWANSADTLEGHHLRVVRKNGRSFDNLLSKLEPTHDLAVVDMPGRNGRAVEEVCQVADLILTPITAWTLMDDWGAENVLKKAWRSNVPAKLVINQMGQACVRRIPARWKRCRTRLSPSCDYGESVIYGLTVPCYAPNRRAARELDKLAREVWRLLHNASLDVEFHTQFEIYASRYKAPGSTTCKATLQSRHNRVRQTTYCRPDLDEEMKAYAVRTNQPVYQAYEHATEEFLHFRG